MTRLERIALLGELKHYILSGGDAALDQAVEQSFWENRWFTHENSRKALHAIAENFLDPENLTRWVNNYPLSDPLHPEETVGIVMAGNIPLVGFHDWLCVFVAGQNAQIKLSEKDKFLLPALVARLGEWAPESWEYTEFLPEGSYLRDFDRVIATGSNNSARYFEQYFKNKPHLIRGNRNGVAVLSGMETQEELFALGRDIFTFFGLGCRNVSKIYVPHGYHFEFLLEILHEYRDIANHDKYRNNFDYNMTLFLLNQMPYLNNGCLLLREDSSLNSRIATIHYEYYDDLADLDRLLEERRNEIQCIVGKVALPAFSVLPFGTSQQPALTDYADGRDTLQFLLEKKNSNIR